MKSILVAAACAASVAAAGQINVAASANGGTATQSSNYINTPASRANDGNRDGRWGIGSVSHTNLDNQAWWRAQFNQPYVINEIIVWNRLDGMEERINPFNVYLKLNGNTVYSVTNITFADTVNDGNVNTKGMNFLPTSVLADEVFVQLSNANYLHMAEVEAYGVVPEPATLIAAAAGIVALSRRRRT
jgi:opacity protein-like surface antigen